ncbi:hypothetical protein NBRC116592_24450 [Colwellia sp. KU-HH00111]|uniref:hypothetical protein n=1 Tax=Colwellia sp. KU-HH00111 TaxID=3127652 RepID=UPI0031057643
MNKEQLVASALNLVKVSPETIVEYSAKRATITAGLNKNLEQREDLDDLVGAGNQDMMRDNHSNHSRFVEAMLNEYNPEVLVDTVLWVFRAYRSHGFQLTYWSAQLNGWLTLLEQELTKQSYLEIEPLYRWFIINQSSFVELTDE